MAEGEYAFSLTVSPKDDFSEDHRRLLVEWHHRHSQAYLVSEPRPMSGVEHYHSLFTSKSKLANTYSRQLTRYFEKHSIPYARKTIVITSAPEPLGLFSYFAKDLNGRQLYLHGWQKTWIDQQVKLLVKKMPHAVLNADVYIVNPKIATGIIIRYAEANNHSLSCKEGFKRCIACMAADKYQFDSIRWKPVYSQVSARMGRPEVMMEMLSDELFNLP